MHRFSPRVLFVDDDRAIHRTVAKMLPGFELCSAYDGTSALVEVDVPYMTRELPGALVAIQDGDRWVAATGESRRAPPAAQPAAESPRCCRRRDARSRR